MIELRFTPAALDDIAGVRLWYGQAGAGHVARAKVRAIREGIRRLRHPQWSRAGRELGHGDRIVVIHGHSIIYRLTPEAVIILRVFGPGQDRPRG